MMQRRREPCGSSILVVLLAWLVGCGGSGDTTDPNGRVLYTPPEGWELVESSGGTRYHPTDAPHLATIQVNTLEDDGTHDLEAEKRAWLDFHERSEEEILEDRTWSDDHHQGHEYVHTVETNHGAGVWHHLLARGDGYRIVAHLQTTSERYPDHQAVFERVVASIRPASP